MLPWRLLRLSDLFYDGKHIFSGYCIQGVILNQQLFADFFQKMNLNGNLGTHFCLINLLWSLKVSRSVGV